VTSYRVTVRNASPGVLLLRGGVLLFKTEYAQALKPGQDEPDPEVYVLASGECYAGDGYDVDCVNVTDELIDGFDLGPWEAP